LSLESHLLLELVVRDTLVVSDEEHVWEAVLRWAAHNPTAGKALPQILTYIRYPLIAKVRAAFIVSKEERWCFPTQQSYLDEHIRPHPFAQLPGVEEAMKLNSASPALRSSRYMNPKKKSGSPNTPVSLSLPLSISFPARVKRCTSGSTSGEGGIAPVAGRHSPSTTHTTITPGMEGALLLGHPRGTR